jgi:hypothetical protein
MKTREEIVSLLLRLETGQDGIMAEFKKMKAERSALKRPDAGTLEECIAYARERKEVAATGELFFDRMESCGWTRNQGKEPLRSWKAHFRVMSANGWLNKGGDKLAL